METRCDQMMLWAAPGGWNAKPDTLYGCPCSAISLEVSGLGPDTHPRTSLFCETEASSNPVPSAMLTREHTHVEILLPLILGQHEVRGKKGAVQGHSWVAWGRLVLSGTQFPDDNFKSSCSLNACFVLGTHAK